MIIINNVEIIEVPEDIRLKDLLMLVDIAKHEVWYACSHAPLTLREMGKTIESVGSMGEIELGFMKKYNFSITWDTLNNKYKLWLSRKGGKK